MKSRSRTRSRSLPSLTRARRRQLVAGLEKLERRDLFALSFQFNFNDGTNFGFNTTDTQLRAQRRDALQAAATEFGSWFNDTATITVFVHNENVGPLHAKGEGAFPDQFPNSGFDPRVPQSKALTGEDRNGLTSDGKLFVNWEDNNPTAGFTWEYGDDVESPNEVDFKTAMIHELTHIMGFLSGIQQDGTDTSEIPRSPGQPGVWDVFDQFVADSSGRLINATGHQLDGARWNVASVGGTTNSTGLFFDGPNAKVANGGNPVPLHSPAVFEPGSSVSHLRIIAPDVTGATHVMIPTKLDGKVARRLHPVEVAIMKDLGYSMTLPTPEIVLSQTGPVIVREGSFNFGKVGVKLSARPPTNVMISVVPEDQTEVAFVTGSLFFTPTNWDQPQFVLVEAADDQDQDGNILSNVNLTVLSALSDPLYNNVSKSFSVRTMDNDTPASIIVGSNNGTQGLVSVYQGGQKKFTFDAFPEGVINGVRVAAGDVNGDGQDDIVVGAIRAGIGAVKVFSGLDGNLIFGAVLGNLSKLRLAASDLNNDGFAEVIVTDGSKASIFDLKLNIITNLTGPFFEVAAGDTNGDGKPDLIFGTESTSEITILSNPPVLFPTPTSKTSIAAADFNSDGLADIVVGGSGDPAVSVLSGVDQTPLFTVTRSATDIQGSIELAAGYIDSDGQADLVVASSTGNSLAVLTNQSNNNFQRAPIIDNTFAGSNVAIAQGNLNPDRSTKLTLTSIPSGPLVIGNSVTVEAKLSHTLIGTPSGSVEFDIAGDKITGTVFDGVATLTLTPTSVADFSISAKFIPTNTEYLGSVAIPIAVNVIKANASFALTSSKNPSLANESITFTATETVSNTPLQRNGNVTFKNNGLSIGTVPLVNGVATLTVPTLTAGTHPITAEYNGDLNFNTSSTAPLVQTVNPGDTTGPIPRLSSSITGATNAVLIPVTIDFDEPVTGFEINDLNVTNGTASILQASGAIVQVLVQPQNDGNVVVSLPAARVFDAAGNGNSSASLTLVSDRTSPSVTLSTVNNPAPSGQFFVNITFNEKVGLPPATEFLINSIQVGNGTASDLVTTDNTVYTVKITATDDTQPVTIDVPEFRTDDLAGNANTAAQRLTVTIDTSSPTVTISSLASSPTKSNIITVFVEFSEVVTGFELSDLTLSNAVAHNLSNLDGRNYFFDVSPNFDGEVKVGVPANIAVDASNKGNLAAPTDLSITVDRVRPTVTLTTANNPASSTTFPVSINFSEIVKATSFAIGDLTVNNGTAANLTTTDNRNFTVSITSTNDQPVIIALPASVTEDLAGNTNTAATSLTVTVDTSSPTVTISSTESSPTKSSSIPVSVVFSEVVTGFALSDLTLINATAIDLQTSADGRTYHFNVTPANDGLVTVGVPANIAVDTSNKGNLAAQNNLSITVDRVRPTVTLATPSNPTVNKTFPVTITFSETVISPPFPIDMITVTNGTASNLTTSDNRTFTVTVTSTNDQPVTIAFPEFVTDDLAGNANTLATPLTVNVDTSRPTATVTSTVPSVTNAITIPVTVTFSELVTGFVLNDVVVENGSKGSFQASADGRTYSFNVTPTNDGTLTIDVPADVAQNSAQRGNLAATRLSILVDRAVPTVALSTTSPSRTKDNTFPVTLTFSEPVSGLFPAEITVINGIPSDLQSSADSRTFTVTVAATNDGDVTVSVPANAAQDAAGNGNSASQTLTVNVDRTGPKPTVTPTSTDSRLLNIPFLINFGEAVSGLDVNDLSKIEVSGGTASSLTPTTQPSTFVLIVRTGGPGTINVKVLAAAAQDATGNPSRESDPATFVSNPRPNVSMVLIERPRTFSPGSTVTFRVSITNTGAAPATGVRARIGVQTPRGLTFSQPNSSSDASFVNGILSFNIGNVEAGANFVRTVSFRVNRVTPPATPGGASVLVSANNEINNLTAEFSVESDSEDEDITDQNLSVTVPEVPEADLSVTTLQDTNITLTPGGFFGQVWSVKNNGPADVSDAVLSITLDPRLQLSTGLSSPGFSQTGQVVTFNIGALAVGATQLRLVTTSVATTATGDAPIIVSGVVTSGISDPKVSDNTFVLETDFEPHPTSTKPLVANGNGSSGGVNQPQVIPLDDLGIDDVNPADFVEIGQPKNGTIDFDPATKSVRYIPAPNFQGPDSFSYTIERAISDSLVLAITNPDGTIDYLGLHSAGWLTSGSAGGSFQFQASLSEASPAVISALTHRTVLPRVALISRDEVQGQNRTKETLRWTMHNVSFDNYGYAYDDQDSRPRESFSAKFGLIEFNVADADQRITSRYHAGFDFESAIPFDSKTFVVAANPLPLTPSLIAQVRGEGNYLQIGNVGGVEIADFSGALDRRGNITAMSEITVRMPGGVNSDRAATFLLQKNFTGESLPAVTLTRGFGTDKQRDAATTWKLSNVKVKSFGTELVNDDTSYIFSLSFASLEATQQVPQDDGSLSPTTVKIESSGTVTGGTNFGNVNLNAGEPVQSGEQVLKSASGSFKLNNIQFAVTRNPSNFDARTIVITKTSDVATPGLIAAVARGASIGDLTYFGRTSRGSEGPTFLEWQLNNVVVTGYQYSSENLGTETIFLTADSIQEKVDLSPTGPGEGPTVTVNTQTQAVTPRSVEFLRRTGFKNDADVYLKINEAEIQLVDLQWDGRGAMSASLPINVYSSEILAATASGQTFATATIFRVKSPEGSSNRPIELQKYELKNFKFNTFSQGDKVDQSPVELVSFSFSELTFTVQDVERRVSKTVTHNFTTSGTTGEPAKFENATERVPDGLSIAGDNIGMNRVNSIAASILPFDVGRSSISLSLTGQNVASLFWDAKVRGTTIPRLSVVNANNGDVLTEFLFRNVRVLGFNFNITAEDPTLDVTLDFDRLDVSQAGKDFAGSDLPLKTAMIDQTSKRATGMGDFGSVTRNDLAGETNLRLGPANSKKIGVDSIGFNMFTDSNKIQSAGFQFAFSGMNQSVPGLIASAAAGLEIVSPQISQFRATTNSSRTNHAYATFDLGSKAKIGNVLIGITDGQDGTVSFGLKPDAVTQKLKLPDARERLVDLPPTSFSFVTQIPSDKIPFVDLQLAPIARAIVSLSVRAGFADGDNDRVDDGLETGAPNNGDGNRDGVKDSQQRNVTSVPHPVTNQYVTVAAPNGQTLNAVTIVSPQVGAPNDLDFRVGLLQYDLTGVAPNAETVITIFVSGTTNFNSFYKYGPTPTNPIPHYYRFLYDGRTGAKLFSDRIELHLIDGERGDDDITVNGRIVDPGAPVINNAQFFYLNPILTADVNDDGLVQPLDALLIINDINLNGVRNLAPPTAFPILEYSFIDVSADNVVSSLDALIVINELNRALGEPSDVGGLRASSEPIDVSPFLLLPPPTYPAFNFGSDEDEESTQSQYVDDVFSEWQ